MSSYQPNYPSIRSYARAKRLFEEITPLRGTYDYRPIGRRSRRNQARIEQDGDAYVIYLYRTPIVTYRADGSVILNSGGWDTQATAQALDSMSPFGCRRSKGKLVVSCSAGSFWLQPTLTFTFDPESKPIDPPGAYTTKRLVNKAKAKQVRKFFAKVPVYIRAFQSAFEGGTKPEGDVLPIPNPFEGGVLPDDTAAFLAWRYVPEGYEASNQYAEPLIQDLGEESVKAFWQQMYQYYAVIEVHQTALPYGVVP